MRNILLATVAGLGLLATSAHAIPAHVCQGPAGPHNPHCNNSTPPPTDRAVPEPGAAGVFALGAGLIALRTRRAR